MKKYTKTQLKKRSNQAAVIDTLDCMNSKLQIEDADEGRMVTVTYQYW